MTKLFKQTNLKGTNGQKDYIDLLLNSFNQKSKDYFIHIFNCQLNNKLRKDKVTEYVPVPWTVKQHFFQGAEIIKLIDSGLIGKTNFSIKKNLCTKYYIREDIFETYYSIGVEDFLNDNEFKHNYVDVNNSDNIELVFTEKDTPINILTLRNKFKEEALIIKNLQGKEKEKAELRFKHNFRCLQTILSRISKKGKNYIWYYQPRYIVPWEGTRKYELGGGLLNLSKDFRRAALPHTNVTTYDAVKCHAQIAHMEILKTGVASGFEDYLNNNITNIPNISLKTIKTAFLSVLNGAKIPRKLNKEDKYNKLTLQKLVINDPLMKGKSYIVKMQGLIQLGSVLTKLKKGINQWIKTMPQLTTMQKLSENLQRLEMKYLQPLHEIACHYQHDGALISNDIPIEILKDIEIPMTITYEDKYNIDYNNILLLENSATNINLSIVEVAPDGYATVNTPYNVPSNIDIYKSKQKDLEIISNNDGSIKEEVLNNIPFFLELNNTYRKLIKSKSTNKYYSINKQYNHNNIYTLKSILSNIVSEESLELFDQTIL